MTSETKARAWEMAADLIDMHGWEYSSKEVLDHAKHVVAAAVVDK